MARTRESAEGLADGVWVIVWWRGSERFHFCCRGTAVPGWFMPPLRGSIYSSERPCLFFCFRTFVSSFVLRGGAASPSIPANTWYRGIWENRSGKGRAPHHHKGYSPTQVLRRQRCH